MCTETLSTPSVEPPPTAANATAAVTAPSQRTEPTPVPDQWKPLFRELTTYYRHLPELLAKSVKDRVHELLEDDMMRWITPPSRGRTVALAAAVLGFIIALGGFGARAGAGPEETAKPPAEVPKGSHIPAEAAGPLGAVKHRAVSEFPLPRDRTEFGIGEAVEFWFERSDDPAMVVSWQVIGPGTVYPVVGFTTTVTVDLSAHDGTFTVEPTQRDAGRTGVVGGSAGDHGLRKWLEEQLGALPKGNLKPAADVQAPPTELREELRNELHKLYPLRKGKRTPYAEVDELGRKLMRKYSDEKEKGQIYYQLAHVYAQSGLEHPERLVAYAKEALRCPLEPGQVPRLYVYWGDAVQVAKADEPVVERRRWAAVPYLAGLKAVLRYDLPEQAPELPAVSKYRVDPLSPGGGIPMEIQQQLAARRIAKFEREMIKHREVLTGQIVSLYRLQPLADEELREIASRILEDSQAVDHLLAKLRDKEVNKRSRWLWLAHE